MDSIHLADTMQYLSSRRAYTSGERHKKFNTVILVELRDIGVKKAMVVLEETTQNGVRLVMLLFSTLYRADIMYKHLLPQVWFFCGFTQWKVQKGIALVNNKNISYMNMDSLII